ncbi:hypothetical protein B0H10DRAFT_1951173 [Mycena sp. CBHHK59/15]|nr:hypothetical protein B0H10DRAFT_1951173 [Mycena sp. CBHHK59/15]
MHACIRLLSPPTWLPFLLPPLLLRLLTDLFPTAASAPSQVGLWNLPQLQHTWRCICSVHPFVTGFDPLLAMTVRNSGSDGETWRGPCFHFRWGGACLLSLGLSCAWEETGPPFSCFSGLWDGAATHATMGITSKRVWQATCCRMTRWAKHRHAGYRHSGGSVMKPGGTMCRLCRMIPHYCFVVMCWWWECPPGRAGLQLRSRWSYGIISCFHPYGYGNVVAIARLTNWDSMRWEEWKGKKKFASNLKLLREDLEEIVEKFECPVSVLCCKARYNCYISGAL